MLHEGDFAFGRIFLKAILLIGGFAFGQRRA
jgi:hypothetical protein